jgi:chromosome segregation ATPase
MAESKMETLRAQVEEASLGSAGNAQAKLLRQIETLQTQSSIASENWQGIETSLLAKVSRLEKEKDDVTRKETESRRKAKDANSKARRLEDELETQKTRIQVVETDLSDLESKLDDLKRRAEGSEQELKRAREDFERSRQTMELETLQRIDEERAKVQAECKAQYEFKSPIHEISRPVSPTGSISNRSFSIPYPARLNSARSLGSDLGSPQTPTNGWWPSIMRRVSAQPSEIESLQRHDSVSSLSQLSEKGNLTAEITEEVSALEGLASNTMAPSPHLISTLTSLIQTLEAKSKAQRQDIASLKKTLSGKATTALEERVTVLEGELERMREREEVALEMLGEKSELVEEQKCDIEDLKNMYKELVERTVGSGTS